MHRHVAATLKPPARNSPHLVSGSPAYPDAAGDQTSAVVLSCLTLLGIAVFSSGRAQQPENVRTLMRMKLSHSHSILEGIALEDFDKIASVSDPGVLAAERGVPRPGSSLWRF